MFQTLSKKLRKKQGFTLIELIVVLAILGIILAIAVPNYLGVQATSATKADGNVLELAENAVDLWYVSTNQTGSSTDLITLTAAGVTTDYFENLSPTPSSSALDGFSLHITYSATGCTAYWAIAGETAPIIGVSAAECSNGTITDEEKADL